MPKQKETPCGRTRSSNGESFTDASIAQHKKDCSYCNGLAESYESLFLGMTDLLAVDELDGVFLGMAWELGEW